MKKIILLLLILIPIQISAGRWVETHHEYNEIVMDLNCNDSTNCLILVQQREYTMIYRSTDQGETWDTLYITDHDDAPYPYLINADDASSPIPSHYYICYDEKGIIEISNDSCKSFKQVDLNYHKNINDIEMLDTNFGIALANITYFITYDGWKTFDRFEHEDQEIIAEGNLESPVIHSENSISFLLATYDYTAYVKLEVDTKDWFLYPFEKSPLGYFGADDLFFVNESLAFICGYYVADTSGGDSSLDCIYRSKDGGKTWNEIIHQEFEPPFGLQKIAFKDENTGIAVGQFGKVLRTSDGGDTWTYDVLPEEMLKDQPPTMKIAWAGEIPILGTYGAGFWRYEDDTFIEELYDSKNIKVKQNSHQLLISIEDDSFSPYQILITDLTGNVLVQQELISGIGTVFKPIDIEDLYNGVYYYTITNAKQTKTGGFTILK